MIKKLSILVPIAGALFGLAACAPMGTTAKEPATTSLPAAAAVQAAPKP
jgi:hypothetical protein